MSTFQFSHRHIGLRPDSQEQMLEFLGVESLDDLVDQAVPSRILERRELDLPEPLTEAAAREELRAMASRNRPDIKSFIRL